LGFMLGGREIKLMDKCRNCGTELPPNHEGPCPKCGAKGRVINLALSDGVGIKDSVSTTHKPEWSSKSLALFSGFVAIFLAIVIPGILYLLPFSMGINYAILIGFLLILGGIFWWQRYNVLMLIRKLESKFGGEKTV